MIFVGITALQGFSVSKLLVFEEYKTQKSFDDYTKSGFSRKTLISGL